MTPSRSCTTLLLLLTLCSGALLAQGKGSKSSMPSQEEMMKRWQEAATPGEGHKVLEALVGTWETSASTWMEGPDKPPSVTTGKAESRWVLDGRFVQQDFSGEMMGQPMSGIGLTGYDNFKKKYVGFWIDNTSTAIYTMEGTIDKAGHVITLYGVSDDPMTGQKNKKVKYVTTIVDENHHTFDIFDVDQKGKARKVVSISYARSES